MGAEHRANGGVAGTQGAVSAPEDVAGAFDRETMPSWDDRGWLLGFVKDRHVPCPRCGYDLRNLESPRCPECGEPLCLRVGLSTPRFGWLLIAVAPGLFSGVCATLLAFPLYRFRNAGPGNGPPAAMYLAEAFGVVSCAAACVLYRKRRVFLGWAARRQGLAASAVWLVHIVAFVALLASFV